MKLHNLLHIFCLIGGALAVKERTVELGEIEEADISVDHGNAGNNMLDYPSDSEIVWPRYEYRSDIDEIQEQQDPTTVEDPANNMSLQDLANIMTEEKRKGWAEICEGILELCAEEDSPASDRLKDAVARLFNAMIAYQGQRNVTKINQLFAAAEDLRLASVAVDSEELKAEVSELLRLVSNQQALTMLVQEAKNPHELLEAALQEAKKVKRTTSIEIRPNSVRRVINLMANVETRDPELMRTIRESLIGLEQMANQPDTRYVCEQLELGMAQLRQLAELTDSTARKTITGAVGALEKFKVKRSFRSLFSADSKQAKLIYISILLTLANIGVGTSFGIMQKSNALIVDAMFGLSAVVRDLGLLAMLKIYRNQVKDGHHPMHIKGIDSKMGLVGSVLVLGVFLQIFMSIIVDLPHLTVQENPLMVVYGTSIGLGINLIQLAISGLLSTESGLRNMRFIKETKDEEGNTVLQLVSAGDSGEKSFAVVSQMLGIFADCLGNITPLISGLVSEYQSRKIGAKLDAGGALALIIYLSYLMLKESILPSFINKGANIVDTHVWRYFKRILRTNFRIPANQIIETHEGGNNVLCILIPYERYDEATRKMLEEKSPKPSIFARLAKKIRHMANGKDEDGGGTDDIERNLSDSESSDDDDGTSGSELKFEICGPMRYLSFKRMHQITIKGREYGIDVSFKPVKITDIANFGPDLIAASAFSKFPKTIGGGNQIKRQ